MSDNRSKFTHRVHEYGHKFNAYIKDGWGFKKGNIDNWTLQGICKSIKSIKAMEFKC